MRRAHTVTFKTEYKGQIVSGYSHDGGSLKFQCDLLKEMRKSITGGEPYETIKTYDSVESILDAIDRYDLSLRKDFTNRVAYRIDVSGWRGEKNRIEQVEVTSVTDDGREAWIKVAKDKHAYGNGRSKVGISTLYNNKEVCQEYVDALNAAGKLYADTSKKLEAALNKETNLWKPLTTKS